MRLFPWLLLFSMVLSPAYASDPPKQDSKNLSEGIKLALKGQKREAWNLLFPEAKAGNVAAMYHLGMMMLQSPEYPDHLQRAKKFFETAANRGHAGSASMLKQVDGMLERKGQLPTIGGTSGLPLPADVEEAKAAYRKFQETMGQFVEPLRVTQPKATIKTFITDDASTVAEIQRIADEVIAKFGDIVEFQYYAIIDQAKWSPQASFAPNTVALPSVGFNADLNGEEARQYGVRSTPAIVIVPENGKPVVLAGPKDIITELSSLLR